MKVKHKIKLEVSTTDYFKLNFECPYFMSLFRLLA